MAGTPDAESILMTGEDSNPPRPSKESVYKQTPQGDLKMFLSLPEGWSEGAGLPAIVFFFGGGWVDGTPEHFSRQAAYFAGRGMVAARADYRVKKRHGQAITPAHCVEDAKSAMRWLRANAARLGIDPGRIIAAGGSAGGHIAACTAMVAGFEADGEDASVSPVPNALVLFNPVMEFDDRRAARFDLTKGEARRLSPILYADRDTPPALLMYGTQDPFCGQGRAMLVKAKDRGNRVELYLAEGARHAFFNEPPWFERTLHRADEFLAALGYLDGPPTVELPK